MSSQPAPDAQSAGFQGHIPPVAPLMTEVVTTLALAAHAYLSEEESGSSNLSSAEIAIDVASLAFDRIKERLGTEERLAITQMLTETRLAYVRKRDGR